MATVPRRGELSKDLRKFVKTQKTDLFCGLKSVISGIFLFSSSEFKLAGEICQKPRTLDLVNLDPQSTVCNLHAHLWSHHPMLDFHTQIKGNIAQLCARFGGAEFLFIFLFYFLWCRTRWWFDGAGKNTNLQCGFPPVLHFYQLDHLTNHNIMKKID